MVRGRALQPVDDVLVRGLVRSDLGRERDEHEQPGHDEEPEQPGRVSRDPDEERPAAGEPGAARERCGRDRH